MKLIFIVVFGIIAGAGSYSQDLKAVKESSLVQFKIKNLGITVNGKFSGLSSSIKFDPAALSTSSFEAQVEAASINTGIDLRDDHLKKEDYFNVKNYPVIKLVSTKITGSNKEGIYFFFGKLTIKQTSLDISFPFTATATTGGYKFIGDFTINRKAFGVGGSSFTLADKVTIHLDVLAVKS